jgi:hypothetical protein
MTMSVPISSTPSSLEPQTKTAEPRAGRSPIRRERRATLPQSVARKAKAERNGTEILVAIRSQVQGANLENVCLVVGGVPHAPSGTSVIRSGDTSSMIELEPGVAGVKAAVYFEISMGNLRVPLISDQVFDFAPGAVCVLTISDHTRAHSPSIEIEGAVARLLRAR